MLLLRVIFLAHSCVYIIVIYIIIGYLYRNITPTVLIDDWSVLVTFEISTNSIRCFHIFVVELYNETINAFTSSTTAIPAVVAYSNQTTTLSIAIVEGLVQNMKYLAMFSTAVGDNEMILSSSVHFSTFDVQDFDFSLYGETIHFTCVFAEGSQARGCNVQLLEGFTVFEQNIPRRCDNINTSTCLTAAISFSFRENAILPKAYTVKVFDWESNSEINYSNPVFAQTVDFSNCIAISSCTDEETTSINTIDTTKTVTTTPQTVVNSTDTRTTLLVSAVSGSSGLFGILIITIILLSICWKRFKSPKKATAPEPIYAEPDTIHKDETTMEDCPAYRHFSRTKTPPTEVIYDEPTTSL